MIDKSSRHRRSTTSSRHHDNDKEKRMSIQHLDDHQILTLRGSSASNGYKKLMKEMSDMSSSSHNRLSWSSRRDEVDRSGNNSHRRRRRSSSLPKQRNGMQDMSKSSHNGLSSSGRRRTSSVAKQSDDVDASGNSSSNRRRSTVLKQREGDGTDVDTSRRRNKSRHSEKIFLKDDKPKPKKITSEMWLLHSDHLNKVQLASKDKLLKEKAAAEMNDHRLVPKKFGPAAAGGGGDPANETTELSGSSLPYRHLGSKHTYRHLGSIPTQHNTQDGIFSDKKTKKKKKKEFEKQSPRPEHGDLQNFLGKADRRPNREGSIISSWF